MEKCLAVYPGAFDPLTNGHYDIIKRSSNIFHKIVVGIATNSKKQTLFSLEERVAMIKEVVQNETNVEVAVLDGLTVEFCKKIGAKAIIRGLRAVSDFDYEYPIAIINKKMAPDVDTLFLMASGDNAFISSTIVKEFAKYKKPLDGIVPEIINQALIKKFK